MRDTSSTFRTSSSALATNKVRKIPAKVIPEVKNNFRTLSDCVVSDAELLFLLFRADGDSTVG